MVHKTASALLVITALAACSMASPQAGSALPAGFEPAAYVPDNPVPQLPPGVTRDDILWRDGCYYSLQGGQPVLLPFIETNPATGVVTEYDRYCIG